MLVGTQIKIDGGLGGPKKLAFADEASRPIPAKISVSDIPAKQYVMPSHQYNGRAEEKSGPRHGVNSRSQFKGSGESPPIQHVGTSYQHVPNAPTLSL